MSTMPDSEKGTSPVDSKVSSLDDGVSYTPEEEARLVRKLDWRILPIVTLLYLANFIDRSNVGNAKVAGLDTDLGLVGTQFNLGLSIFFIVYALSEVPSNLILKRVGPDIWIPSLVLGFGIVVVGTAFIKNFAQFMIVRALLGLFEGGMMPGVAFYLSTYYRRHELVFRICLFINAASIAGAFGGLLASAILKLPEINGLPSGQWRNIFLVEGLITVVLAIGAFFVLPGRKETAKFLTDREREIAITRMSRQASVDDDFSNENWHRAFRSLNTWICGICFLLCNLVVQGISLFMPSVLKGMGHSVIQSQLLTVPPYILASIWSVILAYASFRFGHRGFIIAITTPLCILGLAILLGTPNIDANYAALFFVAAGAFPQGPILLTWATNNAEPSAVRAVSSALTISIGTIGPIISSWIYLSWDAPRYKIANAVEISGQCTLFVLVVFLIWWNHHENLHRAKGGRDYRLDRPEHKVNRLGNLHPHFRLTL